MNEIAESRAAASDAEEKIDWRDYLDSDEIAELREMHDWRNWLCVAVNWGIVFGAMALVAAWPNPLTVIAALFLIGARQLGMAVLMHDASHHALLSNRGINDWVGSWLAAYPTWSDLHTYRPYHLKHHAHTWTEKDPDFKLTAPFPITRSSFRRKVWRDLSGQTGLKFVRFAIRRDFGDEGTLRERWARALANPRFRGMLISNAVILVIASWIGHPALYLLWVGAYLTTNTLVTRIRAIAEHSMVPDPSDELLQTRTTETALWERLLVAPNGVNYHLEHHLVMTVPRYNLPRMHQMLRDRGVLDHALVVRGYASTLRLATSKAA